MRQRRITIHKRPLRIAISHVAGNELLRESLGAGTWRGRLAHVVANPPTARYFGLGAQAARLERTGRAFTLWNTDRFGYRAAGRPLYTSFPFYIALRDGVAHGVFYDNPFRSRFDFAARRRHVGYFAGGGELRYYVMAGPRVEAVLAKYTRLTGRMPLPPRWALGYHQSRWSYHPAEEPYRVAAEFRARGIPCDGLFLDIHYMDGYRVFTWDAERFPDPARMLADLSQQGFKVTAIVDPGVKVDEGYAIYTEGRARGAYVRNPDGSDFTGRVWPGRVVFPDFSRPATRRWWGEIHRPLLDAGVQGIWNDMNEPSVFCPRRTMPDDVRFDNEGRECCHTELHNQYGLLMARATYEALRRLRPDRRPFVLTRSGFSGVQRYAGVWTGDNVSNWTHLWLAMPMVLGLGLAGMPFAGADIGGFMGSPSAALYTRFLQLGVFLPFCRTHSYLRSRRREPWSFGPVYERTYREVISLRYRLLPHLYTAFFQHTRDGSPVVRPLFWGSQDDPATLGVDDQFYFGDHLLVAPVVRDRQDTRTLYLPSGRWYRLSTDETYGGGDTVTVPAPRIVPGAPLDGAGVHGIPLFVRAGAVIPMQEVQQHVGERPLDIIELHVYDGGTASSELYEDDGDGFAHLDGAYRLTRFYTAASDTQLAIRVEREGDYVHAVPRFRVLVHGLGRRPRGVTLDGAPACSDFDPATRVLAFDLPAGGRDARIAR